MAKKIGRSSLIGQQGVNLIEKRVLEMGYLWHPTGGIEAGIDGFIEIRNPATEVVLNSIIQVQSKATQGAFLHETPSSFEFICQARDIEYWLQGNAPVILVVSRPATEEAYWVSVKDYFRDPERRRGGRVRFNRDADQFDVASVSRLMQLAIPTDSGVYFAPPPKREKLYSNLLRVVSVGKNLYIADMSLRTPGELWAELRRLGGEPGGDWILKGGQVVSFRPLSEFPWNQVCDPGTVTDISPEEWGNSEDPGIVRDFVQLLNMCLREKMKDALRYHREKDCYYFVATPDLSPRRLSYQSLGGKANRVVFRAYLSRRDPSRIAYYRHSAFRGRFKRLDRNWWLELVPTYHYTHDGYRLDYYYEDRLSTMRRLERNPAVLGQLLMWADYLARPADMLTHQYPLLTFGRLETVDTQIGIEDKAWLGHEEVDEAELVRKSLTELPLFSHAS